MEALMVWQLTDELNLTEDQSTEFFPKWKKLRRIRGQHHADRIAVLSDLTEVLKDESDRTTELKGLVDSLETLDENFRSAERKVRHELAGILTIEQQARLIVFQAGFERQTRRLIEQIRKERGRRDRKQD
jgi:Spy/CpxP family protein refolding chaperone